MKIFQRQIYILEEHSTLETMAIGNMLVILWELALAVQNMTLIKNSQKLHLQQLSL